MRKPDRIMLETIEEMQMLKEQVGNPDDSRTALIAYRLHQMNETLYQIHQELVKWNNRDETRR